MAHVDRISRLPDAILCKILSSLELKPAICTSILSKRWKLVWTFLEDFDFDFEKYRRETDVLHFRHPLDEALLLYVRIVNQVLSNRDESSKIGKFRLFFHVNIDPILIQDWIHYAASRHVEELDLAAYHYPIPFRFPHNFMESRYLHKLRLKCYDGSMIIPKPPFCFPNLKVLYLERFGFKDEDAFCFPNEPFSGFPNLQQLTLHCCVVDGLMILASKLELLELRFWGNQPQFSTECTILKVATPNLKSFMFEGQVSLICPMEELPYLDEVHVLLYPESPCTDAVKQKMMTNLFKLLDQLKNTKTLALSFQTFEVLSMDTNALLQQYPPFVNLKHLIFFDTPWEKPSEGNVLNESIMAYLTSASKFSDSIIVEYM